MTHAAAVESADAQALDARLKSLEAKVASLAVVAHSALGLSRAALQNASDVATLRADLSAAVDALRSVSVEGEVRG
jgi:hypothetical protein